MLYKYIVNRTESIERSYCLLQRIPCNALYLQQKIGVLHFYIYICNGVEGNHLDRTKNVPSFLCIRIVIRGTSDDDCTRVLFPIRSMRSSESICCIEWNRSQFPIRCLRRFFLHSILFRRSISRLICFCCQAMILLETFRSSIRYHCYFFFFWISLEYHSRSFLHFISFTFFSRRLLNTKSAFFFVYDSGILVLSDVAVRKSCSYIEVK